MRTDDTRKLEEAATAEADKGGRRPNLAPGTASAIAAFSTFVLCTIFAEMTGVVGNRGMLPTLFLMAATGLGAYLITNEAWSGWYRRHDTAFKKLKDRNTSAK